MNSAVLKWQIIQISDSAARSCTDFDRVQIFLTVSWCNNLRNLYSTHCYRTPQKMFSVELSSCSSLLHNNTLHMTKFGNLTWQVFKVVYSSTVFQ